MSLTLDPTTTALVLIDLQRGITSGTTTPHSTGQVIARAADLARRFRERGALVVLVHVDPGRKGELFPRVAADIERKPMAVPLEWTRIVGELGPEPEDVVITKHQPSAFYGTDLEIHLRRRGIRTIVLGGISTNVGVESTARAAYERGFDQIFVEDAMAAREADLHEHAVKRFLPTIGRVRSAREVMEALG